jgi:hypothetical protein
MKHLSVERRKTARKKFGYEWTITFNSSAPPEGLDEFPEFQIEQGVVPQGETPAQEVGVEQLQEAAGVCDICDSDGHVARRHCELCTDGIPKCKPGEWLSHCVYVGAVPAHNRRSTKGRSTTSIEWASTVEQREADQFPYERPNGVDAYQNVSYGVRRMSTDWLGYTYYLTGGKFDFVPARTVLARMGRTLRTVEDAATFDDCIHAAWDAGVHDRIFASPVKSTTLGFEWGLTATTVRDIPHMADADVCQAAAYVLRDRIAGWISCQVGDICIDMGPRSEDHVVVGDEHVSWSLLLYDMDDGGGGLSREILQRPGWLFGFVPSVCTRDTLLDGFETAGGLVSLAMKRERGFDEDKIFKTLAEKPIQVKELCQGLYDAWATNEN